MTFKANCQRHTHNFPTIHYPLPILFAVSAASRRAVSSQHRWTIPSRFVVRSSCGTRSALMACRASFGTCRRRHSSPHSISLMPSHALRGTSPNGYFSQHLRMVRYTRSTCSACAKTRQAEESQRRSVGLESAISLELEIKILERLKSV